MSWQFRLDLVNASTWPGLMLTGRCKLIDPDEEAGADLPGVSYARLPWGGFGEPVIRGPGAAAV